MYLAPRGFVTLPLIAFVVILGAFAGLAIKLNGAPHVSQVAAAEEVLVNKSSPVNCSSAIEKAVRLGAPTDGPAHSVDSRVIDVTANVLPSSEILVSCFGAVLKEGMIPPYTPEKYTCVGRSGSVNISSTGVIADSVPDARVPIGKCAFSNLPGSLSGSMSSAMLLGQGANALMPPDQSAGLDTGSANKTNNASLYTSTDSNVTQSVNTPDMATAPSVTNLASKEPSQVEDAPQSNASVPDVPSPRSYSSLAERSIAMTVGDAPKTYESSGFENAQETDTAGNSGTAVPAQSGFRTAESNTDDSIQKEGKTLLASLDSLPVREPPTAVWKPELPDTGSRLEYTMDTKGMPESSNIEDRRNCTENSTDPVCGNERTASNDQRSGVCSESDWWCPKKPTKEQVDTQVAQQERDSQKGDDTQVASNEAPPKQQTASERNAEIIRNAKPIEYQRVSLENVPPDMRPPLTADESDLNYMKSLGYECSSEGMFPGQYRCMQPIAGIPSKEILGKAPIVPKTIPAGSEGPQSTMGAPTMTADTWWKPSDIPTVSQAMSPTPYMRPDWAVEPGSSYGAAPDAKLFSGPSSVDSSYKEGDSTILLGQNEPDPGISAMGSSGNALTNVTPKMRDDFEKLGAICTSAKNPPNAEEGWADCDMSNVSPAPENTPNATSDSGGGQSNPPVTMHACDPTGSGECVMGVRDPSKADIENLERQGYTCNIPSGYSYEPGSWVACRSDTAILKFKDGPDDGVAFRDPKQGEINEMQRLGYTCNVPSDHDYQQKTGEWFACWPKSPADTGGATSPSPISTYPGVPTNGATPRMFCQGQVATLILNGKPQPNTFISSCQPLSGSTS